MPCQSTHRTVTPSSSAYLPRSVGTTIESWGHNNYRCLLYIHNQPYRQSGHQGAQTPLLMHIGYLWVRRQENHKTSISLSRLMLYGSGILGSEDLVKAFIESEDECSHLCNTDCENPLHTVSEPCLENLARKCCTHRNRGLCEHSPTCIEPEPANEIENVPVLYTVTIDFASLEKLDLQKFVTKDVFQQRMNDDESEEEYKKENDKDIEETPKVQRKLQVRPTSARNRISCRFRRSLEIALAESERDAREEFGNDWLPSDYAIYRHKASCP